MKTKPVEDLVPGDVVRIPLSITVMARVTANTDNPHGSSLEGDRLLHVSYDDLSVIGDVIDGNEIVAIGSKVLLEVIDG